MAKLNFKINLREGKIKILKIYSFLYVFKRRQIKEFRYANKMARPNNIQRPIHSTYPEDAGPSLAMQSFGQDSRVQIIDDTNQQPDDQEDDASKKERHKRDRRPLYRRIYSYLRTAWGGVKFTSGDGTLSFITIFSFKAP